MGSPLVSYEIQPQYLLIPCDISLTCLLYRVLSQMTLSLPEFVPLYKKNDKTDVGNYRPVSILNVVSKVIEGVIYDQLEEYLIKNRLVYEFQLGFRHGFTTDTCLIHLSGYISFQKDKCYLVGMVLLVFKRHLIQRIIPFF